MICQTFDPKDQQQVKTFVLSILSEYKFAYNLCLDTDLDNISGVYFKGNGTFFLLKKKNIIIGTIAVKDRGDRKAELKRFYVNKKYRGRGFGTMLLDTALQYCKSSFSEVVLDTWRRFDRARSMYNKRGFKQTKQVDEQIFMSKEL